MPFADDAGCVKFAESLSETLCWFSLESNNPVIKQHCDAGGRSCYVEGDQSSHLFQTANTGLMSEYSKITETVAPQVLEEISTWILNVATK